MFPSRGFFSIRRPSMQLLEMPLSFLERSHRQSDYVKRFWLIRRYRKRCGLRNIFLWVYVNCNSCMWRFETAYFFYIFQVFYVSIYLDICGIFSILTTLNVPASRFSTVAAAHLAFSSLTLPLPRTNPWHGRNAPSAGPEGTSASPEAAGTCLSLLFHATSSGSPTALTPHPDQSTALSADLCSSLLGPAAPFLHPKQGGKRGGGPFCT